MRQARPTSIDLKAAEIDRARISQDRLTMSQTTPVAPGSADQSNRDIRNRLTQSQSSTNAPGSADVD